MTSPTHENRLLAFLPESEAAILQRMLEPRTSARGEVLCEVGAQVTTVYFPLDCVLSSVTTMEDGGSIEGLLSGNEGVTGSAALFGVLPSPWRIVVQVAGTALAGDVGALARALPRLPALSERLVRHAHAMQQQATQSVACNRFHPIHERLARWLLMVLDRTGGNEVELTHEFLAQMLGTYRPSVTVALATLERAGLLHRAGRGRLVIPDRDALEAASCECYERVAEYLTDAAAPWRTETRESAGS